MTTDKVVPLHPPKSDIDEQWQQLEAQQKQIKEQLLKILETKQNEKHHRNRDSLHCDKAKLDGR